VTEAERKVLRAQIDVRRRELINPKKPGGRRRPVGGYGPRKKAEA
jgi:hypothetical protein